jgi:hypothetical protein
MTDVFSGKFTETDPTDPTKTVEVLVYHAVAVVGYTSDNEIVFFDPAKGNFQVALLISTIFNKLVQSNSKSI